MSKVKLAIRVRPFSEREIKSEQDRVRVVNVIDDNYVTITNIKVSLSGAGDSRERVRRYYADYTFDSACSPNQPTYATQEKIFETVGREVLASISHGSSTCVLAYGQSATGKTHTMMGSEAQPGLIPRICRDLAEGQPCDITISFLEIYNERVHDLLVGETSIPTCHSLPRRRGNARKDLRVREHPAKGPYVQNLRRVAVNNVEALLSLVCEGTRRRCTAATRRNSTSSRSHALLEIATSRATLHLADLAGSEKAAWEGCRGRQKEGANINKSLVALSNVISALVGGRGRFVPYRDSALTWLLKDSFTGGANTFIIATVSPSSTCYGESASTLRWAERARQLRTPKTICGVSLVPRAVLQAQYDQLISELTRSYIRYIPETGKLIFDHQHWELYSTKFNSIEKVKLTFPDTEMDQTQQKANENLESISSSVASGSSDIVNELGNTKITNAINEELDNFLCPSLERTSSGSNLKVIAPLRHKRRQYRSQEVLAPDDKISASPLSIVSPSQSEIEINISKADKNKIPHVPILHENQRAEIVASVTERLYSKFKKKEEAAVSKIESVVDRKIVEPLSELRICTNARQRLMELSRKALRNKRRIGIPAYTQTRTSVIRVKDQATDVQTDLGTYIVENKKVYSFCRDVGTETIPITPRCKEIAVGSKYDLVNLNETSTGTQTKNVHCKTGFVMTDNPIICNQYTQTQAIPPPRRKKCILDSTKNGSKDISPAAISAPVISINISQTYSLDSESHSSEESLENISSIKPITPTPDLLTNHNTSDTKVEEESNQELNTSHKYVDDIHHRIDDTVNKSQVDRDEFSSDQEEIQLPRISVSDSIPASNFEMRHTILGRNKDIYPYNIVLSPLKDKENTKRLVTFKDSDIDDGLNTTSESSWDWDDGVGSKLDPSLRINKTETEWKNIETLGSIYSESSNYSNVDTDSFIKRKGRTIPKDYFSKQYVSIYKNIQKPKDVNKCCKEHLSHNVNERFDNASCDSGNDTLRHQDFKMKYNTFLTKNHTNGDNFLKKINVYCNDLENSTKRYDNYLQNYRSKITRTNRQGFDKKPKEFLQELVQLRREAIKSSGDNTDSSYLVPGDST